jgi:hypothetical protein
MGYCRQTLPGVAQKHIMKRLDHGHLHPKLEVLGLTSPGWDWNPGLQRGRRVH